MLEGLFWMACSAFVMFLYMLTIAMPGMLYKFIQQNEDKSFYIEDEYYFIKIEKKKPEDLE